MSLRSDDRAMLRRLFTWARANGWRRDRRRGGWIGWEKTGTAYTVFFDDILGDRDEGADGTKMHAFHGYGWLDLWVTSVGQAADVLAAVRLLPAEMSSAFQAGIDSLDWHYGVSTPYGRIDDFGTDAERAFCFAEPVDKYPQLPVLRQRRGPWFEAVIP